MNNDDWALVVGINHYPFARVSQLEGAVHDAEKFYQWVIDSRGGGVKKNQAFLLTSPTSSTGNRVPTPNFMDLLSFFHEVQNMPDNMVRRRLYIYLSGHGISPTGQESIRNAALLMANAKTPSLLYSFPGNIWAEGVRSAAFFKEVVLIMDCCRDLQNNAHLFDHIFGAPVIDSKDCFLIQAYATGWASKSRELPLPPDFQKQGVFTHALLKVLGAGRMTGTVLKESIQRHLVELLKDEKKAQEPQIEGEKDLPEIIFNEDAAPARTPVTIKNHPSVPPKIRHFPEGEDDLVPTELSDWSYDASNSSWSGTLLPYQYQLEIPATGRSRRLKIAAALPEEVIL